MPPGTSSPRRSPIMRSPSGAVCPLVRCGWSPLTPGTSPGPWPLAARPRSSPVPAWCSVRSATSPASSARIWPRWPSRSSPATGEPAAVSGRLPPGARRGGHPNVVQEWSAATGLAAVERAGVVVGGGGAADAGAVGDAVLEPGFELVAVPGAGGDVLGAVGGGHDHALGVADQAVARLDPA